MKFEFPCGVRHSAHTTRTCSMRRLQNVPNSSTSSLASPFMTLPPGFLLQAKSEVPMEGSRGGPLGSLSSTEMDSKEPNQKPFCDCGIVGLLVSALLFVPPGALTLPPPNCTSPKVTKQALILLRSGCCFHPGNAHLTARVTL